MNKKESLALYKKGLDAWIAWADQMLDEREALEAAGAWNEREVVYVLNDETKAWYVAAKADFNQVNFGETTDFFAFNFPGDVSFDSATFEGNVSFDGATFGGDASFDDVTFEDGASFIDAIFTGDVSFDGAIFGGAGDFYDSIFMHSAIFRAVKAQNGFSLSYASFFAVPDFIQAHFVEAPVLDNIRIEQRYRPKMLDRVSYTPDVLFSNLGPTMLDRVRELSVGEPNLAARWRALKRLAIQGHDHAREQAFFKCELKARRWNEDKPWHAVFWFGLLYQVLSDFGRSIWRPIAWWAASVVIFAILYLGHHPALAQESWSGMGWLFQRLTGWGGGSTPLACVAGPGEPVTSAFTLSVQKGLLLSGLVPASKLDQLYACLYGIHSADGAQMDRLPAAFSPVIPDGVTVLGFLQYPLSAVLIFLLLLAIRNHFRIK